MQQGHDQGCSLRRICPPVVETMRNCHQPGMLGGPPASLDGLGQRHCARYIYRIDTELMPASAHTVETIAAALQGGYGTMAKRFLQAHGLARGAGDAVSDLAERIVRYGAGGSLSDTDISDLLRELAESGEKRVFVMRGDPSKMRTVKAADFGTKAVSSLDHVRINRRPKGPHLNYALITADRVRLSYSETHGFFKVHWSERTVEDLDRTAVVVIEANLHSGIVTLAFDRPGRHDHGTTASAFFDYYIQNEAPALLNSELVALEYYDLLHAAEKDKYRELVRPGVVRGLGDDGCGLVLIGQGATDLRDYKTYQDHRGGLALRKSGRLVWKATNPKPDDMSVVRDGRALLRDVSTFITADPAMVRFDKHTLSHETSYVFRKIREIA
jgi:hypothetical protein